MAKFHMLAAIWFTFIFLTLCACQASPIRVCPSFTYRGFNPSPAGLQVLDCPASSVQVIQNAFSGAVEMAFQAATRLQDEGRASQITDLYNALFVDQTVANGRPSISSVANIYSQLYNTPFIFHCNPLWYTELQNRKSITIQEEEAACSGTEIAETFIIRSGTFNPSLSSSYGPNGPFSSGAHVMLCPNWFNEPPLSNIPQAAVGSYIGGFNTQAATILHEMTHVYSSSINDGAYGFFGCINLAHGIVEPGLTMVPPVKNADTFTFFAMGCSSFGNMNQFNWTSGFAQIPS